MKTRFSLNRREQNIFLFFQWVVLKWLIYRLNVLQKQAEKIGRNKFIYKYKAQREGSFGNLTFFLHLTSVIKNTYMESEK